ncbi:Bifunctional protein GlmU (Includes: UDP-N-acetylglucosamine pyrophosphorylase; Glucosamine-1-phosphate N-acetyltransferase) [groundwater metagenome]|uniref:Bifunctional protein GlmU n=1 Tax=groundwater metagenome TaxID=717931 RepID=A0A098E9Z2_9ZZZZ
MECVLLAGGEGKRMRPLTLTKPKPMLPVAGKPILERNLEILAKFFKKIYVVVGYKKEVVMQHFGNKFNAAEIEYLEQKEQLGTANAILTLKEKIRDKFIVMNGDIVVSENVIKNFINFANENNTENAMCLTNVENPSEFGVVEIEKESKRIAMIEEKPKNPKSNLINAGIYLFDNKIFHLIDNLRKSERAEYEITDAIKILIKNKEIYGYVIDNNEFWIDVGKPWDLLTANEILLKNIKSEIYGNVEERVTIKNNIFVGEGTEILSGCYIIGPCYIGNNCKIGPNTFIRPYTSVGDNCHIGNAVEIKGAIIMGNTNVPHLSYVGDSIIGEHCNLGAGTNIANLRHDKASVKIKINDKVIDSRRIKLGAIIGDDVKTGINTTILPGTVIYPNARINAGEIVKHEVKF